MQVDLTFSTYMLIISYMYYMLHILEIDDRNTVLTPGYIILIVIHIDLISHGDLKPSDDLLVHIKVL